MVPFRIASTSLNFEFFLVQVFPTDRTKPSFLRRIKILVPSLTSEGKVNRNLNSQLPLIKASIKKSRRFLKSVAAQAHEENKKLRRERNVAAAVAAAASASEVDTKVQGKQDSQTNHWIDVCSRYLDEFTNLAGNIQLLTPVSKSAEPKPAGSAKPAAAKPAAAKPATAKPATPKPATAKPATAKPATAESANESSEGNEPKKFQFPDYDFDKLKQAVEYLSQHTSETLLASSHDIFPDETTTQSPARAVGKDGSQSKQEEKTSESYRRDVLGALKHARIVLNGIPNARYQLSKASKAKKVKCSESASKLVTELITGKKGSSDKNVPAKSPDTEVSEIIEAARNLENSSNASSCSCLSNQSDKAEGWTVLDDPHGDNSEGKLNNASN